MISEIGRIKTSFGLWIETFKLVIQFLIKLNFLHVKMCRLDNENRKNSKFSF